MPKRTIPSSKQAITPHKRGRPPLSKPSTLLKSVARNRVASTDAAAAGNGESGQRPSRARKPSAKLVLIQSELQDFALSKSVLKRPRDAAPSPVFSAKRIKSNNPTPITPDWKLRDQVKDDALEVPFAFKHDPSFSKKPTSFHKLLTQKITSNPITKEFTEETLRSGEVDSIRRLSRIVLEKLSGRRPIPLIHLEEEYASVKHVVEATVTAGEGNSMLIIGGRGTGKTTLINHLLADLAKTQKDHFHVIRLNGLIQTDDKLALREIWRQLGREMEIEEEEGDTGKSYVDTLTMLLALLSHPDEITGLSSLGRIAKSVVFVMEEFDLFATHSRQTLLYNLLDIAQARKAPIAVLGVTTKFDAKESLEKRVKSRFSHRYVYVPFAKSLAAFQDICVAALSLQSSELSVQERTEILQITMHSASTIGKPVDLMSEWNVAVQNLFQDTIFINRYIRPTYQLNKSISTILSTLLLPLFVICTNPTTSIPYLLAPAKVLPLLLQHDHNYNQRFPPISNLPLLLAPLSDLQLALLIAAARLDVIHRHDDADILWLSFAMAYAEYVTLAGKARVQSAAAGASAVGAVTKVWGKPMARVQWEGLVRLGLLIPAGVGTGMLRVDVKLEEIAGAVERISSTMEKWCKQL